MTPEPVKILEATFPITLEMLHDFTSMVAIGAGCEWEIFTDWDQAVAEYKRVKEIQLAKFGALLRNAAGERSEVKP